MEERGSRVEVIKTDEGKVFIRREGWRQEEERINWVEEKKHVVVGDKIKMG